jgi:signal peptidase II
MGGGILIQKIIDRYRYLAGIAGIVLLLDQVTKILVRTRLAFDEPWIPIPWLGENFIIVHWKNEGSAFGFFGGAGELIAILAVITAVGILVFFPRISQNDWSMRLSLSLLFGGIIGNLIDRIIQGYVTDIFSINYGSVFNLADLSNLLAVIILVVGWGIEEWKKRTPEVKNQ